MYDCRQFYIDGRWVDPVIPQPFPCINPATEEEIGLISLGNEIDADNAVRAAERAFRSYSETTIAERLALLKRVIECYESRMEKLAETISVEMGCPISLSLSAQAPAGLRHLSETVKVIQRFEFEAVRGTTLMRKEAIGVCGLITPWNWPMNQILCKVAPALAAGCTMVLKPSEFAPFSAYLLAQILHEAGVPEGVFNLVYGHGPVVGSAIASHPAVAMVSFTGSVRAGVAVALSAATTVKRVTQELGGKSAYIVLDDADLEYGVRECVKACFRNSGQSCNAPTRLLVPYHQMAHSAKIAERAALELTVGDPLAPGTYMGPLANKFQFDKVQMNIEQSISEGAELVTGGVGRPRNITKGYFAKPTVFAKVEPDMTCAREEIFGPVLAIMAYEDESDAVRIANDTHYGLSGYVISGDIERARRVAKQIKSGNVHINGAPLDFAACFGGYKQSGNGREWGEAGLNEFLELKAILGYRP